MMVSVPLRIAARWRVPKQVALLFLTFAACICVLLRYQLANKFTTLHGDRYDMVIVVTILEHWYHVFRGEAQWTQVAYFFPYGRTIAQTDAYFLVGVAYFPFRALGLDPFLATELSGVILKAVGFFGAWWMARRVFALPFSWALLVAAMFTLSNAMTVHGQRLQLATVALTPVVGTMVWIAVKAFLTSDGQRLRWFGAGAGVLLGMWCLTCFYMAWFFSFFLTILLIVVVAFGGHDGLKLLGQAFRKHYLSLALVLIVTAVAMAPFIYAFLPKSMEVGVRSYETVAPNTIPLQNVLQVGHENLLFGPIYNAIISYIFPNYRPNGEYYNTGVTPIVFFLFACGVGALLLRRDWSSRDLLAPAVVIAALIAWGLALNVGGHSAWYFVYQWFPGAQALNVVSALQILLALPVMVIAVQFLSKTEASRPILVLIVGLLLAGELNKSHQALDRNAEIERIRLAEQPPPACKAFYVSGWNGQDDIPGFPAAINNLYAHNVSAMLIAQLVGISTLNGIASFNPKDWDFGHPNGANYDDRMRAYARKHGVESVCKLNLNTKSWSLTEDYAKH
ncbi:hypothetical protein [Cupriavidus sp. L7L]|uniref:hypothetical protein n=1 Tax=Cupriavidus sp. L7L TaxID=2546443 RepID=UPI0010550BE2|nr:hypothetical protein [Cupriavidus sp. L7L]TDF67698.1 hypothetical protein E1J61_01720 [Cupriavidus sp. L7L]